METKYKLSETDHDSIFREQIEPAYFLVTSSVTNPRAIIVVGQPGAGKTKVLEKSKNEFESKNAVVANTDDLRSYHPQYQEICSQDDTISAEYTHADASTWRQALIDSAIKTQRNIIIEGVFKRSENLLSTIRALKNNGYEVTCRFVAVHERNSVWGIHKRYEKEKIVRGHGRYVPLLYHNECYEKLPDNAKLVEDQGIADKLEVLDREGKTLFSNVTERGKWKSVLGVKEAIMTERSRSLSNAEATEYKESWNRVFEYMKSRSAPKHEVDALQGLVDKYSREI